MLMIRLHIVEVRIKNSKADVVTLILVPPGSIGAPSNNPSMSVGIFTLEVAWTALQGHRKLPCHRNGDKRGEQEPISSTIAQPCFCDQVRDAFA